MKNKKRIILAITIVIISYIGFKFYYHYRPHKLGDIINVEELTVNKTEIKFKQYNWMEDREYIFTIKDSETINYILDYLKNQRVRKFAGFWSNGVSSDAEDYDISFKEPYSHIYIIGSQYVDISKYSGKFTWGRYAFKEKLDLTLLREITEKKIKELDNKNINTSDLNLTNIFPKEPRFFWDYEGENTFKYIRLDKVTTTEAKKTFSVSWTTSDLSKVKGFNEHIFHEKYDLTKDTIIHDETVLLKSPLEEGNTWKTKVPLTVKGEIHTYEGSITITNITDDTITTKLIIPDLEFYLDNKYIEKNVYKKGLGIISKKYNAPDIRFDESTLGYDLKAAYRDIYELINPEILKSYGNKLNEVYRAKTVKPKQQ